MALTVQLGQPIIGEEQGQGYIQCTRDLDVGIDPRVQTAGLDALDLAIADAGQVGKPLLSKIPVLPETADDHTDPQALTEDVRIDWITSHIETLEAQWSKIHARSGVLYDLETPKGEAARMHVRYSQGGAVNIAAARRTKSEEHMSDRQTPHGFTSGEAYRWRLAQRRLAESEGVNVNALEEADRTRLVGNLRADLDDILKLCLDLSARRCPDANDGRDAQAS